VFFNYSSTNISSDSNIILVSHNNSECGILVDKVFDVHSVPVNSIGKNISTIEKNTSKSHINEEKTININSNRIKL